MYLFWFFIPTPSKDLEILVLYFFGNYYQIFANSPCWNYLHRILQKLTWMLRVKEENYCQSEWLALVKGFPGMAGTHPRPCRLGFERLFLVGGSGPYPEQISSQLTSMGAQKMSLKNKTQINCLPLKNKFYEMFPVLPTSNPINSQCKTRNFSFDSFLIKANKWFQRCIKNHVKHLRWSILQK